MKNILLKTILLAFFATFSLLSYGQNNYSLKFYALGVHPFDDVNESILTRKIGEKGKFAFEPGFIASAELFINTDKVSIKPMQSIYYDRLGKIAGFTHLGLRAYVYNYKKHSIVLGVGTSLFYRQNWANTENYVDEDIYKLSNGFQYKTFILSGEIEYNYYLSKLNYFSVSLNQIDLMAFTVAVGYKQMFNPKKKKHNKRKKACDCPSYR